MNQSNENKYKKSIIYGIYCKTTNMIYIGSTIQKLYQRLSLHKNQIKYNRPLCSSQIIILNDNYDVFVIEDFPCKSKDELRKREEYHRKMNPNAINHVKCYISEEEKLEYHIQYRINNKERQKELTKKHYEENKEQYLERAKQQREKIRNNLELTEKEREYKKIKAREYYEKDIEKKREYHKIKAKERYEKNKDKINEKRKQKYQEKKEKMLS